MGGKLTGGTRHSSEDAIAVADKVQKWLYSTDCVEWVSRTGSLRRLKDDIGDVDTVVLVKEGREQELGVHIARKFGFQVNGKPNRSGVIDGIQVDLLVTDKGGYGAAMMHFTGPFQLNIRQRNVAKTKGLKLNEKGLWRGSERIAGESEEEVYKALGLDWLEPEDRK